MESEAGHYAILLSLAETYIDKRKSENALKGVGCL